MRRKKSEVDKNFTALSQRAGGLIKKKRKRQKMKKPKERDMSEIAWKPHN